MGHFLTRINVCYKQSGTETDPALWSRIVNARGLLPYEGLLAQRYQCRRRSHEFFKTERATVTFPRAPQIELSLVPSIVINRTFSKFHKCAILGGIFGNYMLNAYLLRHYRSLIGASPQTPGLAALECLGKEGRRSFNDEDVVVLPNPSIRALWLVVRRHDDKSHLKDGWHTVVVSMPFLDQVGDSTPSRISKDTLPTKLTVLSGFA